MRHAHFIARGQEREQPHDVSILEEHMMTDNYRQAQGRETSLEKYLRMNEKEKDLEIQKAVDRLQKRIQEILYALDSDSSRAAGPGSGKNNGQPTM
jgi:hypothetical protein